MQDYFAALAARTLQPQLGVQPRRRLRWEEAPSPLDDLTDVARQTVTSVPRTGQPAEEERPSATARRASAEARRSGREHVGPPAERARPSRMRASYDGGTPIGGVVAMPHPTVRPTEPAMTVRPPAVEARGGQVLTNNPEVDARRTREDAGPHPRPRAFGTPTRSAASDRDSTRPEPVIRIHIGRVDVRAVSVPAPTRPAARDRRAALMSLDEYVQKRDRGAS